MGPAVIPQVLSRINDPSRRLSYGVALVASEFGEDSVPYLTTLATGKDTEKQLKAIELLEFLHEKSATAVPVLTKLTTHENAEVRAAVGGALASTMDGRAIPVLLNLARNDSDYFVQQQALASLVRFDRKLKPHIRELIDIGTSNPKYPDDLRYLAFNVLSQLGGDAVPDLVRLIEDPKSSRRTRTFAMRSVHDIATYRGGKEANGAVTCLTGVVNGKDPELQKQAAETLGQIGPEAKASITTLEAFMRTFKRLKRLDVAHAILKIDASNQTARQVFLDLVEQKEDSQLQYSALFYLSRFARKTPVIVPTLIKLLEDKDEKIRRLACSTIENTGDEGKMAIGKLMELAAADSCKEVREAAASALKELTKE
jgi:HEAT repeat protein